MTSLQCWSHLWFTAEKEISSETREPLSDPQRSLPDPSSTRKFFVLLLPTKNIQAGEARNTSCATRATNNHLFKTKKRTNAKMSACSEGEETTPAELYVFFTLWLYCPKWETLPQTKNSQQNREWRWSTENSLQTCECFTIQTLKESLHRE